MSQTNHTVVGCSPTYVGLRQVFVRVWLARQVLYLSLTSNLPGLKDPGCFG